MTSAIFLDRDGTLNEQAPPHEHVTTREQFRFLPGVLDALAFLAQNSERRIAIVTNQSCIGRGTATRAQVDALHAWMVGQIESAGGRVDGLYICPHRFEDACRCRKPGPGMFLDAAREMGVDLGRSVIVGNTITDMIAARCASVRECYLSLAGWPYEHPPPDEGDAYTVTGDLSDAARLIVARERRV